MLKETKSYIREFKESVQFDMLTAPHQTSKRERWPKALRRWLSSIHQIIETVNDKLLNMFRWRVKGLMT